MDIAEFAVLRSPRRTSKLNPRFLFFEPTEEATPADQPGMDPHGPRLRNVGPRTIWNINTGAMEEVTVLGDEEVKRAETDEKTEANEKDDRIESTAYASTINFDADYVKFLKLMMKVDQWLIDHEDQADGQALRKWLESQMSEAEYDNYSVFSQQLGKNLSSLVDSLASVLGEPAQGNAAALFTRFLLMGQILSLEEKELVGLRPAGTWDLLHNKTPVFPSRYFPGNRQNFVPLVRDASVGDLAVIRKEWVCYLPGEIANIRNLMGGEKFGHQMLNVREVENITQTETEERTQTLTETEQSTDTEFSNEVNTQLNLSLSGSFNVQTEFKYPIGSTSISAGINGDVSYGRSTRHASQIAQKAVSRASSNVDKRTREWRQRRELQRTEDETTYELKNETTENKRAVYRWVDRVDRYQTILYPERLQLEFQIPEPATYFRKRTAATQNKAAAQAPPPFNVQLSEITPANVLNLAATYHATNIPALRDEKMTVITSKTFMPTQGGGANGGGTPPNPAVGGEIEVIVPEGYSATRVTITGFAHAAYGTWFFTDGNKWGYFDISLSSTVGKMMAGNSRGGAVDVQVNGNKYVLNLLNTANQPYSFNFSPYAEGTLKFGALGYGISHAVMSFELECVRTSEVMLAWQLSVYDALFAGWKQWQEEWEATQSSQAFLNGISAIEGSSLRNTLTVRDELKRQVIGWLLQESPFEGRPALLNQARITDENFDGFGPQWKDMDIPRALIDAPIIQFLEQAFDWGLMGYIFYPYYWADDGRWDELSGIQANDPDFERFLKAGSARVVVPARKNMEPAVFHYLVTGQPFMNQPMPIPDDPMYLSIAREIQDLTEPPKDGIPGESWEVQSTTTLVILEDLEELPRNPNTRLTPPPDPLCDDLEEDPPA